MTPRRFNLKDRINSFAPAFKGLKWYFLNVHNGFLHSLAAVCVCIVAFLVRMHVWEWTVLLICIGSVVCLEIMNSAIEQLVDLVSPEFHELAGITKDLAAAAVLFGSLMAAIIGSIVFLNHLFFE